MQLHRSVLVSFKNKYVPQLIVDDTYPGGMPDMSGMAQPPPEEDVAEID